VKRDDLDRLLHDLAHVDGSDLHLKSGAPPRWRVNGVLSTLEGPPLAPKDTSELAVAIMPPNIREIFEAKHEADFAYSVQGLGRFRVNVFCQRGSVALAMRLVHTNPSTVAELGLPDVVRRLAEERRDGRRVRVNEAHGQSHRPTLAEHVHPEAPKPLN